MKYATERPYSDPEKAARRLMEHAHAFEPVQDGRIYVEKLNGPFLFGDKGTPAEYSAGLELAIKRGWLELFLFGNTSNVSTVGPNFRLPFNAVRFTIRNTGAGIFLSPINFFPDRSANAAAIVVGAAIRSGLPAIRWLVELRLNAMGNEVQQQNEGDMISVLIGVLIIVVVGAICFWAIDKFATDSKLANLLKLLVVLICLGAILQRVLPLTY
jgi:hypothetical protein